MTEAHGVGDAAGQHRMAGGCQCGAVRYTAQIPVLEASLCHCRMCQRATGGFAAALVTVPRAAVDWHGAPTWFDSSPIAQRPFCPRCGSPLGFAFRDSPDMELTLGSFDAPEAFTPTGHFGTESLHDAWLDTRALPRQTSGDNPRVAERWRGAGQEVP